MEFLTGEGNKCIQNNEPYLCKDRRNMMIFYVCLFLVVVSFISSVGVALSSNASTKSFIHIIASIFTSFILLSHIYNGQTLQGLCKAILISCLITCTVGMI